MGDMKNHNRGTAICERWLREEYHCNPVITEAHGINGEVVDALGFVPRGGPSILVDWKNSHADAVAHMSKSHVVNPIEGVGEYRWIACRPGIVDAYQFPAWPSWLGLVWINEDGQVETVRHALQRLGGNYLAQTELLRAYAANAGYHKAGAVQLQTWLDKAANLLGESQELYAYTIMRELQLKMSADRVAKELNKDARFIQDRAGTPFRLRKIMNTDAA